MQLIVYYEVPTGEGQRDEVKRKFDNYAISSYFIITKKLLIYNSKQLFYYN